MLRSLVRVFHVPYFHCYKMGQEHSGKSFFFFYHSHLGWLHTRCTHAHTAVNSNHQLVLLWHFQSLLMTRQLIYNCDTGIKFLCGEQSVPIHCPWLISQPSVSYSDIVYSLVLMTCSVAHCQMKAYKTLEAYNYFLSG